MTRFSDGIANIVNQLANRRSAVAVNRIVSTKLDWPQMRAIYRSGLGSKIVRIKAGYALNDTLQFESAQDEKLYKAKLERQVKNAAKLMIGFGRGIILINERGANHSKPATSFDLSRVKLDVFSGDMVTAQGVSIDLDDPRWPPGLGLYVALGGMDAAEVTEVLRG